MCRKMRRKEVNMKNNTNIGQKILKSGIVSWIIFFLIWGLGSLAYQEYF